jgi:hypothetical protein
MEQPPWKQFHRFLIKEYGTNTHSHYTSRNENLRLGTSSQKPRRESGVVVTTCNLSTHVEEGGS